MTFLKYLRFHDIHMYLPPPYSPEYDMSPDSRRNILQETLLFSTIGILISKICVFILLSCIPIIYTYYIFAVIW